MDYEHVKKQLGYGIQTESKDNSIKALEQLQAKIAELEAENAKLHEQIDLQVPKMAFTQLKEQLAKAEQRVVEAIVGMLQQKHRNCFGAHSFYLAASVATANGEWRKFMKES